MEVVRANIESNGADVETRRACIAAIAWQRRGKLRRWSNVLEKWTRLDLRHSTA